jgi:hypothetical protein
MNYKKLYEQLINKCRSENRKKFDGIYYESHHIIPKSIGGSNCDENKVLLTGKEHFFAHKLLFLIYPNIPSIVKAYHAMFAHLVKRGLKPSSRNYGEIRKAMSNIPAWNKGKTGFKHTEETKKKMRESHLGKKMSQNSKLKNSEKHLRKNLSEETLKKMSDVKKGKTRAKFSEETIQKMSTAAAKCKVSYWKGKKLSEETKRKMSLAKKGKSLHKQSELTREKIRNSMKKK